MKSAVAATGDASMHISVPSVVLNVTHTMSGVLAVAKEAIGIDPNVQYLCIALVERPIPSHDLYIAPVDAINPNSYAKISVSETN